jgi:ABC-type multidrug transport system permease subunit
MFLVGSAILMCRHATTMSLSTVLMCLSAIVMYGLESILFNPAMLPVGSAIVGDWLQLFLATLNLFLYLDREGLLARNDPFF